MKKFLKQILIFIPVSIITYFILICIWGSYFPNFLCSNLITSKNNNTKVRLNEVTNYENIDILFLGSSRAFSTFDVRMYEELGYKVFNLGSSGQSPIQTEVLLNRYLDKLNPKLIIYEVSPKVFASDGIESATDIIANGELDYYSFDMAINLMHLKILNTLIFRIYSEVFYKKTQIPLSIDEPKRTYIKGGFVQVDLKEYNPLKRIGNWRKKEMNKKQVEAFENIVTMAKNREIKLSLVQVPFTKEEYLQYDNQSFNEFISKYGSYYDFNQIELLTDKKYFRDNLHLNTEGVLVFNKQIIKQFKLADEQIKY